MISTPPAAATRHQPQMIEVWMAGHQQAAQSFVNAVSTPGSPGYRRFLNPAGYTRRFGPSAGQITAVESYLTARGFSDVQASTNDDYVSALVPSSDTALKLPASLSRTVLGVTGFDRTAQTAAPSGTAAATPGVRDTTSGPNGTTGGLNAQCTTYWGQQPQAISPSYEGLSTGALPVCGYSAGQIRSAYGLPAASTDGDSGQGRTIALVEVGSPVKMFATLIHYARLNQLPAPRAHQYHEVALHETPASDSCLDGAQDEATLDSEAAYAVAPGANQLMIDGDDCDTADDTSQALLDAMLYPLTGRSTRAAIESVSYGMGNYTEKNIPAFIDKITHSVLLRAAAEGVSVLNASGDSPGVDPPSDDPDITSVGGTTLGIGANGQRLFETGWSTDFGERSKKAGPDAVWHDEGVLLGGGGGVSDAYAEPSYQKDIVPAAMAQDAKGRAGRTVPDIAADGDPYSGMLFGIIYTDRQGKAMPYETFKQAGTSTATPLVAGIIADAEQGTKVNLGFLNPLLYSMAGSPAFNDLLPVSPTDPEIDRVYSTIGAVDIANSFSLGDVLGIIDAQGVRGTTQVTAPGYDTMTGLGSPNGSALIQGLRAAS